MGRLSDVVSSTIKKRADQTRMPDWLPLFGAGVAAVLAVFLFGTALFTDNDPPAARAEGARSGALVPSGASSTTLSSPASTTTRSSPAVSSDPSVSLPVTSTSPSSAGVVDVVDADGVSREIPAAAYDLAVDAANASVSGVFADLPVLNTPPTLPAGASIVDIVLTGADEFGPTASRVTLRVTLRSGSAEHVRDIQLVDAGRWQASFI